MTNKKEKKEKACKKTKNIPMETTKALSIVVKLSFNYELGGTLSDQHLKQSVKVNVTFIW